MLNGYIVISAVLALIFVLLGVAVLYRNPKSHINKLFLAFSACIALWLVTNYMGSTVSMPYEVAYVANRLVFLFGVMSTLALLVFARSLVNLGFPKQWKLLIGANAISILGSATPWIVEGIKAQNPTYTITFGWLASIYFLTLFCDFLFIITSLLRSRKKTYGVQRAQIDTILVSLAVTLGAVLITNALLPAALNYYGLTNAGSFFTVILVSGIAYSIVRHKLFDLRLVVARSLAYVLSIAVVASLYIAVVFGVSSLIFHIKIAVNQQVYLGLFSAITVLSFRVIKSAFDKFSNRLFFRNAYDPQDFLDKLSNITVNSIDLSAILKNSSKLILDEFKVQTCNFVLLKPDGDIFESSQIDKAHYSAYNVLRQVVHANKRRPILYSDETIEPKLKRAMGTMNAELILILEANNARIGYIILGVKNSGQSFNAQDLKVLGIGIDSLAVSIQNALRFEEISKFNLTLQDKVEQATRQLRKANERLRALDETKDDFISMASHQLRTPLTSVKGYISMVLDGDAGKITHMQRDMLGQAFLSSQRMVYLIADLLNVSRLKTGKFVIESAPLNLADLVSQELKQLEETAGSRSLTISYDKPKSFPTLMLDETKIRQVIMNFVDNAIYYTPAGGHITVELADNPLAIELRVKDSGIGVPKHEQAHLFSKFYRASNAKQARPDGTGLGLFMAKKVVVAQGGAVIFDSQEGKGSTFGFVLNKAKLAALPKKTAPPKAQLAAR